MKKVPVFVVLIGCVFSWLIASMNPVTKIIDQSVYSYFNYQLMAIGFAISLLVGIILLWFIKRKEQYRWNCRYYGQSRRCIEDF